MFDTVHEARFTVSHDRPCQGCGHAMHTYLACSDTCDCTPVAAPVTTSVAVAAGAFQLTA